jgi:hypothetical protein
VSTLRKDYKAFCAGLTGERYLGIDGYYRSHSDRARWLSERKGQVIEEDRAWFHAQLDMARYVGD